MWLCAWKYNDWKVIGSTRKLWVITVFSKISSHCTEIFFKDAYTKSEGERARSPCYLWVLGAKKGCNDTFGCTCSPSFHLGFQSLRLAKVCFKRVCYFVISKSTNLI